MLVRFADRLDRQGEDVEIVRYERGGAVEIALVDEGVDADRQMRTVLLDRGDGEERDRPVHVARPEILRRQVEPVTQGHHLSSSSRAAAITSTSTLNTGRAKPRDDHQG